MQFFKDLADLSSAGADLVAEQAARAVHQRGRFLFALSGGSTPAELYRLLALPVFSDRIDWRVTHVFWVDERCVPPQAPGSNYGLASRAFLGLVPIPPENIHAVRAELEPSAAAQDYATALVRFADPPLAWPRFDLVLLGLGADGHVASLFPGLALDAEGATLTVSASYEGRPTARVTVTLAVLNSARSLVFLVSGESKSKVLARVLHAGNQPGRLPAHLVQPWDGRVIWLVDEAAATGIDRERLE